MGRWWPIFSGISVVSHYTLWQNVLDPRMHAVRMNRLFNIVVCMAFYGNNIYCYLQMFNFDDQAAHVT